MKEDHDAILVTLAQGTIKDRKGGIRTIYREWSEADGINVTWWYKLGTVPKSLERIQWVYWVIKGRIRWRSRILEIESGIMQFEGMSRPMSSKYWLVMFDFEPVPRIHQKPFKGFQGFRYISTWYRG